jgi:hypothetical protein
MSAYAVMKLCREIERNPEFRAGAQESPAEASASFNLTDEERQAFLSGDVKKLHNLGAHGFLLSRLAMHGIVGLTAESYAQRLRGPFPEKPR